MSTLSSFAPKYWAKSLTACRAWCDEDVTSDITSCKTLRISVYRDKSELCRSSV